MVDSLDRRLPVYLLLDCSGSMSGEPIAAMQIGLSALVEELRNEPYALETVWLSVITFASTASQVIPLTDISEFHSADLEAGGTTALGEALQLLEECVDQEVRKGSAEQKADWKPLAFVFTDGEPTDSWHDVSRRLREANAVNIVVCGAGSEVNEATLRELSPTVIRLENTQPGSLSSFLKWVTMSVTATSKSLGTGRPASLPAFSADTTSGDAA